MVGVDRGTDERRACRRLPRISRDPDVPGRGLDNGDARIGSFPDLFPGSRPLSLTAVRWIGERILSLFSPSRRSGLSVSSGRRTKGSQRQGTSESPNRAGPTWHCSTPTICGIRPNWSCRLLNSRGQDHPCAPAVMSSSTTGPGGGSESSDSMTDRRRYVDGWRSRATAWLWLPWRSSDERRSTICVGSIPRSPSRLISTSLSGWARRATSTPSTRCWSAIGFTPGRCTARSAVWPATCRLSMTACFLMGESHRSSGGAARTWPSTSACRNCFGAGWLPRYAIWAGRVGPGLNCERPTRGQASGVPAPGCPETGRRGLTLRKSVSGFRCLNDHCAATCRIHGSAHGINHQ